MQALPRTLPDALRDVIGRRGDAVALRNADGSAAWTWRQLEAQALRVAGGLSRLGVGPGDAVGLLLENRLEFFAADLGAVLLGAVPVSIYGTSSAEQLAYVLRDAGAEVLIHQASHAVVVDQAQLGSGPVRRVVVNGGGRDEELTWDELSGGQPLAAAASPDQHDLLTIIYTSGTTGPPKGVNLSHRNVLTAVAATGEANALRGGDRVISWLPMAHIAERKASYYAAIAYGLDVTICPDPRKVLELLPTVRPTWFFAVPRIWEKLKAAAEVLGPVPHEEVRERLGLDALRAANVGAAPCSFDVIAFFHELGIPLTEVYGMTENCACCTSGRPGQTKIGTVGTAMPGVDVRLAEDGEVLMRSATVMGGYRRQPDATADIIDEEGWLHTGDVGSLDADGHLTIIDRKKELIVNSAGKNISPANVESAIKAASPLIGQVCVVGDRRPYLVALVVPDAEAAAGRDAATVRAEIDVAIAAGNSRL